jgi:hypothetical protein
MTLTKHGFGRPPRHCRRVLILSVDTGRIRDEGVANTVTLARARKLWKDGLVEDSNLAFMRLATQFDFNLDKLREFYAANEGTP